MRGRADSGAGRAPSWRAFVATAFAPLIVALATTSAVHAQLRVSPGPLARAHAALEGVTRCGRCHDSVQGVSAARCLGCHKAIAARIASRAGVHRAVTGNCGKCHREHAGVDVDLRHFDTRTFDHAVETGFALDGRHVKVSATCTACHKQRSFVAARPACGTCHADVHKGALGADCASCHSTAVPFKETRRSFDHARARFALTGAHRKVDCEKCHAAGVFRGLKFDGCSACHKEPHRRPLGPACTNCHVTDRWAVATFDHAKTAFGLAGAHARVPCAKCHPSGVKTLPKFDRCAACHADVHRGKFQEDCRKCHKETSFRNVTFEHGVRTRFPLVGKHEGVACRKCHVSMSPGEVPLAQKLVDFGGLSAACVSCHKDQHKGEYGRVCDACHRPASFKAAGFAHPRSPEFFGGRHQGVKCVRCHVRADASQGSIAPASSDLARAPSMACIGCHADVHLGQVGTACDRCHAVDAVRFAPARFSHDATGFALTGKHRAASCDKCHPRDVRASSPGSSPTMRLRPMSAECQSCHKDPHLGQVNGKCATCHSTAAFTVATYGHPGQEYTFSIGSHETLPCKSCHRTETRQFPGGWGTALRLKVGRACKDCHG